jgi:hypothetical protein
MDNRRKVPYVSPNRHDDLASRLRDDQKMIEALDTAFDERVFSIRRRLVGHDPTELAAQGRALWDLPDDTLIVLAHAFETFGSVDHTIRWLLGGGSAIMLGDSTPLDQLRYGRKETVDDVLTRIDAGLHGSTR